MHHRKSAECERHKIFQKQPGKKNIFPKRSNNKVNSDFLTEIIDTRRQWNNFFKIENDDVC